jgi:ribosomal protein L35
LKTISERKRWKQTGKGKSPPFLQILKHVIDSPQFAAIPGSAHKLLVDMAREYRGPGTNNGNISFDDIRQHNANKWSSRATRQAAVNYLVEHGWLVRTRRGGLHMGCDLFAVSWWPIDECDGKHDYPAEKVASNLWAKKMTVRNPELAVPESGPSPDQKVSNVQLVVPESGTAEHKFKAA